MSQNFDYLDQIENCVEDVDNLKQFTIPKLKKSSSDGLTLVDTDSFEYKKDILEVIQQRFKLKESLHNFNFFDAYLVNNPILLLEFDERRKMLKETCNLKDVKLNYTFLHLSSRTEAETICKEGLKIGNSKSMALGNPEMGVYVNRHPDILPPSFNKKSQTCFLLIFKHIIGKAKSMVENTTGDCLDPTPGFDCHMIKTTSNTTDIYSSSQIFIYEYDSDLDVIDRPRQLLPFALVSFKIKNITRSQRSDVRPNRIETKFRNQKGKYDLKDRNNKEVPFDDLPTKNSGIYVKDNLFHKQNEIIDNPSIITEKHIYQRQKSTMNFDINKLHMNLLQELKSGTKALWSGELQVPNKAPMLLSATTSYLHAFPYHLYEEHIICCTAEDTIENIFQQFGLDRVPRIKLNTQTFWRGFFIDYIELIPSKQSLPYFLEMQHYMFNHNKGYTCVMEGGKVNLLIFPCGDSIKRLGLEGTDGLYGIFMSTIPYSVNQDFKEEDEVEEGMALEAEKEPDGDLNEDFDYPEVTNEININNTQKNYFDDKLESDYNYQNENSNVAYTNKKYNTFEYNHSHRVEPQSNIIDPINNDNYTVMRDDRYIENDNFIYNDVESHKGSTMNEAQIIEENETEAFEEHSNKDNEDGIDDELADKIVLNCLKNSKGILSNPVLNDNTSEPTVDIKELAPQDNPKEANIIEGGSNETAYEDDDRRLLESILMQGDSLDMDQKDSKTVKNSKMLECGDGSELYETIASPPRSDPREERLLLKTLNEDKRNRRKLVAKPVDVVLERQEDNPSRLFLYDNFTKGLYQNFTVTIGKKFVEENKEYKKIDLYTINTDHLLSSIHEGYKLKNNNGVNESDNELLLSGSYMNSLNMDHLLEALNNWHGDSTNFRVIERVDRADQKTFNYGGKSADENTRSSDMYNISYDDKHIDYDSLSKRYKMKIDGIKGLPYVIKPHTNYRELNFCEDSEGDCHKEVITDFPNGMNRNAYRPSVSFRQHYEEIMDFYDLKKMEDGAWIEGRNTNSTNEWILFDHNNNYTALFSASKITDDDKPSNDEEDGAIAYNAVDYKTSIDNFAWFPSQDDFKTTKKVLKEEKSKMRESTKDDCNLDFLFNLSQPSSFGSFTSIPFLEGSCNSKQPFNVLFDNINKGHKKPKKTRSSKPISTMKWPASLTFVDINFPGSYKVVKNEELNDLLNMDVDTNLDPRLACQIDRDSLYWPIVNGTSVETLVDNASSGNMFEEKYTNSITFKSDKASNENIKSEIYLKNEDPKDVATRDEYIKKEIKETIMDSDDKKLSDEPIINDEKIIKMETGSKMEREAFNIHVIIDPGNLKRWYASSDKVRNHEILLKVFDQIFELNTIEEKSVDNVVTQNEYFSNEIITDHSPIYNDNCPDNDKDDEEMLYDPVTSCLNNDDNSLSNDADEVMSSANDDFKDDVRNDDKQFSNKNSLKLIDYSSSSSDEEDDDKIVIKKDIISEFTNKVNKKRHARSNYNIDFKKIKIDHSTNKNHMEKVSRISKVHSQRCQKLHACASCLQFYTKKYMKFHNSLRHPFKHSQHLFVHALFGLECLKKLFQFKDMENLFYWLKTSIENKEYQDYILKITSREFETIFKSCFPIACVEVLRKWSIRSKDFLQKFSYALAIAIHFQLTNMKSVNNFKNTKFDLVLNKLDKVLIQSSNNLIDASNDITAKSDSSRICKIIPVFQRLEDCLKESESSFSNGIFISSNIKYLSDYLRNFQSKAFCRLKMSNRYMEITKKERLKDKSKRVDMCDKRNVTNSSSENILGHRENPTTPKLFTAPKTSTIVPPLNDSLHKIANSQAPKVLNSANSNVINISQNKEINENKITSQVENQMGKTTQKRFFMPSQLFPKQGKVKMTATGAKIFQPKSTSIYQTFKPSLFNQKQKTETVIKNPVKTATKVETDFQKNEKNTINYKTIFKNEALFFEANKITSIESRPNKEVDDCPNRATTPTFDDISSQANTDTHNETLQAQTIGWNVQPCQLSQPAFQQYYSYQPYNIAYNTYPPQAFIPQQTPYPNASFYPQSQFNNPPSTYIMPNIQVNMPLNTDAQNSFASDSTKSDNNEAKSSVVEPYHRRIFIFNKERFISKEIQDFLTSKGALSFDPHNITLLRPLNNVQCFVLIYKEDLPVLNEIPNLIELKKDLRVKFLVYKDITDVKLQRFEVVFGKGGQVYIEEDTLLNFCTDVLSKMLELISKQTATKPWKVVLSSSTQTTINDLMVSSSDDSTLEQHIRTLSEILEKFKFLIEYLPENDKFFIQKPLYSQHYLHNLMSLQTRNNSKYRHFFLITERMPRANSIKEFRRNGVDVLSVSDFMKGFLSTIVPTNKIECGDPLDDVPSLYLDAKLSSACRSARNC